MTFTLKEILIKLPRENFIWGQIGKVMLEGSEFNKNEMSNKKKDSFKNNSQSYMSNLQCYYML